MFASIPSLAAYAIAAAVEEVNGGDGRRYRGSKDAPLAHLRRIAAYLCAAHAERAAWRAAHPGVSIQVEVVPGLRD